MKSIIQILCIIILIFVIYVGYQTIVKDKSIKETGKTISSVVDDTSFKSTEKLLDLLLSKNMIPHGTIKCFNDSEYDLSCSLMNVKDKAEEYKFNLTLYGMTDIASIILRTSNIMQKNIKLRIDNFDPILITNQDLSDYKMKESIKNNLFYELIFNTSNIDNQKNSFSAKAKLNIGVAESEKYFSTTISVIGGDSAKKSVEILEECFATVDNGKPCSKAGTQSGEELLDNLVNDTYLNEFLLQSNDINTYMLNKAYSSSEEKQNQSFNMFKEAWRSNINSGHVLGITPTNNSGDYLDSDKADPMSLNIARYMACEKPNIKIEIKPRNGQVVSLKAIYDNIKEAKSLLNNNILDINVE